MPQDLNHKNVGNGLAEKGVWCYRMGGYRVVAEIKQKEILILVIDIGYGARFIKIKI